MMRVILTAGSAIPNGDPTKKPVVTDNGLFNLSQAADKHPSLHIPFQTARQQALFRKIVG